jgi:hypothetical protein
MSEEQWLACRRPARLLRDARSWLTDRKLRLVLAAYCRRVSDLLTDRDSRSAVDINERYADKKASKRDLGDARRAAARAKERVGRRCSAPSGGISWNHYYAASAVVHSCCEDLWCDDYSSVLVEQSVFPSFASYATTGSYSTITTSPRVDLVVGDTHRMITHGEQIAILHHILGNPFRPYEASHAWPEAVVALADSVYAGDHAARLPLHDALLEFGHPTLAEHFAAEAIHPKGCWVIDLITQREPSHVVHNG